MDSAGTNAAYAEGYAQGSILLLAMRQGGDMQEPLRKIHGRYLAQVQLTRPTAAERAYVAGFRDAVSDNLPCPPHGVEIPTTSAPPDTPVAQVVAQAISQRSATRA